MKTATWAMVFVFAMGAVADAKHSHDHASAAPRRLVRDDDLRNRKARGESRWGFDEHDRRLLCEYYGRRRPLPAGLRKKLNRTGHLPPGWERRIEPLAPYVEIRMAPLPRNYRRGVMNDIVVVYERRTAMIVDIATLSGSD